MDSGSGQCHAGESARGVVLETGADDEIGGSSGQRGGLGPGASPDGEGRPLGQGHRERRRRANVPRHVDGAGQDGVGFVVVAAENTGDAFHGERRSPQHAPGCQQTPGRPGVGTHLRHAVTGQVRPKEGEPGVDGAPIGQPPVEVTSFRGVGPLQGRTRMANQRLHPGGVEGDVRILDDQTPLREPAEPPPGRVDPSSGEGGLGEGGHESGHAFGVSEESGGFCLRHGQVGGSDFHQLASGPEQAGGQRWPAPRGDGQL